MSRKSKTKKSKDVGHSTLAEHRHHGKSLIPPFAQLPPSVQSKSWRDERLPEMLWAALLVTHLPRSEALGVFRELADCIHRLSKAHESDQPYSVTLSSLAKLKPEVLQEILGIIASDNELKQILRPLLLFRELPARDYWQGVLEQTPSAEDWRNLMLAVAKTLDHQSQESTDCRWVRVICIMAAGKLAFPKQLEELAKEFAYYPDYGDMRKVRPSIRAIELALDSAAEIDQGWADKFWTQCLLDTPCFPLPSTSVPTFVVGTTPERVRQVYNLLVEHGNQTVSTTAIDAKHDTVFGIAFYCLGILQELLRVGASQSITARIGLRTLVECFVTLSYLVKQDNPDLWKSYRVFGAGQAKLQYLKLEDLDQPIHYVNAETLKELANEDIWEEFLPIELGHWNKADLRTLSIEADVKDEYDRFYAWTSSFAHGHWGSVRDTVYDSCGNPLHRLHRIPRNSPRALPDVVPDACTLVDKALGIVSKCYGDFPHQVTIKT